MTGLKGGASCHHRSKKNYIDTKAIRNKLKKSVISCEECDRLEKQGKPTLRENDDVFMCTKCAALVCNTHAKLHCEAERTGDCHPLIFCPSKVSIKCHPCDATLEPLEDSNDPIKLFYHEYKSFTNIKNDANRNRNSQPFAAPAVLKPEDASQSKEDEGKDEVSQKKKIVGNGSIPKNIEYSLTGSNETLIPAKGLANLGNTCFYNSVMQCIMHTHHLQYYFERFGRVNSLKFDDSRTVVVNEEKVTLNASEIEVLKDDAPLNTVLRGFISEFRSGTTPSPGTVFTQIARKAPRFKGWQQQDAHELLRYLLDGLRSEEIEWYKQGIAAHLGLKTTTNPKKVEPQLVKSAKGYLQAAGRPLLDTVFGGTLLQTIRCSECGHVSERNEQFLDLSIPLSSNPMSTRVASVSSTISSHQNQKKKQQARKNLRRQQSRTKAPVAQSEDDSISNGVEELDISDASDEEEAPTIGNPLDYTKALVSPPNEYTRERNLGACLLEFTAEEILAGSNAYECEKCCTPRNKKMDAKGSSKKRVQALKRYLIYEPPAVLTLHLKRFQQLSGLTGRLTTRKLGGHVDFPILFNIAPFCCKNVERINPGQKQILYSLYGVVVHSGDLSGGHYIAYVKSRHRVSQAPLFLEAARASSVDAMASPTAPIDTAIPDTPVAPDGQWYYCSDSRVTAVSESKVLAAEAYILFYERLL